MNPYYKDNDSISQFAITEIQTLTTNQIVASYLKPYQSKTEIKNLLNLIGSCQDDQQIIEQVSFTLELLKSPNQSTPLCANCQCLCCGQALGLTIQVTIKFLSNIWCCNCLNQQNKMWVHWQFDKFMLGIVWGLLSPFMLVLTILLFSVIPFIFILFCILGIAGAKRETVQEQKIDPVISVLQKLVLRLKQKIKK